jgi:transposase
VLEGLDLLRLDSLAFTGYEERDGMLIVGVLPANAPVPTCSCADPKVRRHGVRTVKFRDHPIQRQPVFLEVSRQRYRCETCKSILLEEISDLDAKRLMTERFRNQLAHDGIWHTFRDAGKINGVKESLVRRVFTAYAEVRLENYTYELPRVLGMDEKVIQGKARFVVGDAEARKMLDLQPSRKKLDLEEYFSRWDFMDRAQVEVITQDMYWGYKDLNERYFRNAMVVVDKWHVVKYANDAVDTIRKSVQKDTEEGKRLALKRGSRVLTTNPKKLKPAEKVILETILDEYPRVRTAWNMKELFFDIYNSRDRREAEDAYGAWVEMLEPDIRYAFADILRFMKEKRWREFIFNYFDHRYTNGYIEGLNSLFSHLNIVGRGYNLKIIRAKALLRYGKVEPLIDKYAFHLRLDDPETETILNTVIGHGVDISTFERDLVTESFW